MAELEVLEQQLEATRNALLSQIAKVDAALAALRGTEAVGGQPTTGARAEKRRSGPSVRELTVLLLGEAHRSWTARAIHDELTARGHNVTSSKKTDPSAAVRSALTHALDRGQVVKLSDGSYLAAKWVESGAGSIRTLETATG